MNLSDLTPLPLPDYEIAISLVDPGKPERVYEIIVALLLGMDKPRAARLTATKFQEMLMENGR